jgi:hypothetical protein
LDNYIQSTADYENLVLDGSNQRFLLWKETDLKECGGKGVTICPADKPVYGMNVLTCESSLYFQRDGARTVQPEDITEELRPNIRPTLPLTGYIASATNSKLFSSVARMQRGLLRPGPCKGGASFTTPGLAM